MKIWKLTWLPGACQGLFFFKKGFQVPLIISCDLQTGQVCVTEARGGTPLYAFFSRFGHKLGIDFSHFAAILVINRVSIFAL